MSDKDNWWIFGLDRKKSGYSLKMEKLKVREIQDIKGNLLISLNTPPKIRPDKGYFVSSTDQCVYKGRDVCYRMAAEWLRKEIKEAQDRSDGLLKALNNHAADNMASVKKLPEIASCCPGGEEAVV